MGTTSKGSSQPLFLDTSTGLNRICQVAGRRKENKWDTVNKMVDVKLTNDIMIAPWASQQA